MPSARMEAGLLAYVESGGQRLVPCGGGGTPPGPSILDRRKAWRWPGRESFGRVGAVAGGLGAVFGGMGLIAGSVRKGLERLRPGETFSETLLRLIRERGLDEVEVYSRAHVDRRHFSKIRRRDYHPGKDTVLALVLALELEPEEADRLLASAGYALSRGIEVDLAVDYCLRNGVYDLMSLNEWLESRKLRPIRA